MEMIQAGLRALGVSRPEHLRRRLITSLRELADSLEDPNDTVHRYGYLHLQTASVKVGFNLGLFKLFKKAEGPLTVKEIADHTKAEEAFIRRYMRYLASIGAVREVDKDTYAANNVTRNLSEEVTEAGISHCFQTCGRQFQAIPEFLKKTSYTNPSNEVQTVFQDAYDTDKHAFPWFADHPEELKYFNDYMAFRREPSLSWLTVYPVEQETKDMTADRAVYVNIGGGIGHQCEQFKVKFPKIPGRVILQDMPHSIEKAMATSGVENMIHDFFQPQPIKGAKFYFSRGVLHNHPDHKVRQLLLQTKAAMAPDSIILLDEMVLPETKTNSYAAAMDLVMMSAFAAGERTEAQWRTIVEEVGLKLVKTYAYNPESYESVMDHIQHADFTSGQDLVLLKWVWEELRRHHTQASGSRRG